jgi:hypothetical protein
MIDALAVSILLAGPLQDAHWFLEAIKSRGAEAVLKEAFDDPVQWSRVTEGIEAGNATWLDVAEALGAVSDAGATYALTLSVGKALVQRPTEVLARLAKERLLPIFSPESVCGQYDVDGPDSRLEDGMAFLLAQEKALRTVTAPALQRLRERCLTEIRKAPENLRLFYGGSNKGSKSTGLHNNRGS